MSAEDLYRCVDVKPVKGGARERGRSLTRAELTALFRACGDGPAGNRDAAALAILYGCRRSEPVALDVADYLAREAWANPCTYAEDSCYDRTRLNNQL